MALPPRKKSRFFSDGEGRHVSQVHQSQQIVDPDSSISSFSSTPPVKLQSNSNEDNEITTAANQAAHSCIEGSNSSSSTTSMNSAQGKIDSHTENTEEGQVEETDGLDFEHSDLSPGTASAMKRLSIRDKRRHGVYGLQGLLSSASGTMLTQSSTNEVETAQPVESHVPSGFTFGASSTLRNGMNHSHQLLPFSTAKCGQSPVPFTFTAAPSALISTSAADVNATNDSRPSFTRNPRGQFPSRPVFNTGSLSSFPPVTKQAMQSNLAEQQPLPGEKDTISLNGLPDQDAPPQDLQVTPEKTAETVSHVQQEHSLPGARPQLETIDLDRDSEGKRLPIGLVQSVDNLRHHGITRHPLHTAPTPSHRRHFSYPNQNSPPTLPNIPANMYTSPNRIRNASFTARLALKRKRPHLILPPRAYVHSPGNFSEFNIFQGILLYPELCFALAAQLPVMDLILLYAVSRDFHTIIDSRFTTVILSQALRKAPESSRVFPFRMYLTHCRKDPTARIPHPDPLKAANGIVRRIPSFRWLHMVLHREKVVHEIMAMFAEDGIPLPARCSLALKRMWILFDIPENARRVGFIHSPRVMPAMDLYFLMCFFVKLDMRCNDPVAPEKRDGLRKLVLSQSDGLMAVWGLLNRTDPRWTSKLNVMRTWVRAKYNHIEEDDPEEESRTKSIFGVPLSECGKHQLEYWGQRTEEQVGRPLQYLLRPDQLIMRETIRRGFQFNKHFLRSLLCGYVRPDTLSDYQPRKYGRRIEELKDDEYGLADLIGGVASLAVEEGGDELLDLGPQRLGSVFCIEKEQVGALERETRREQDEFLDKCVEWMRREKQELETDGMTD